MADKHQIVSKPKDKKAFSHKTVSATALTAIAVLLVCGALTGTVAYLVATAGPLVNTFDPSQPPEISVVETFDGATKENVKMHLTPGDGTYYVRAEAVFTFEDDSGNIIPYTPVKDTDYSVTYNTADWFQGSDNYWYYKSPVLPDSSTNNLIVTCAPVNTSSKAAEYRLTVEILTQMILDLEAEANWPVTVGTNGILSAKTGGGA